VIVDRTDNDNAVASKIMTVDVTDRTQPLTYSMTLTGPYRVGDHATLDVAIDNPYSASFTAYVNWADGHTDNFPLPAGMTGFTLMHDYWNDDLIGSEVTVTLNPSDGRGAVTHTAPIPGYPFHAPLSVWVTNGSGSEGWFTVNAHVLDPGESGGSYTYYWELYGWDLGEPHSDQPHVIRPVEENGRYTSTWNFKLDDQHDYDYDRAEVTVGELDDDGDTGAGDKAIIRDWYTWALSLAPDDPVPTVTIGDSLPVHEGGTAAFDLTLSALCPHDVNVSYETCDWTATAGEDYVPEIGTAWIPAGQTTTTIHVPVIWDLSDSSPEGFYAAVTGVEGAEGGGSGWATVLHPRPMVTVDNPTVTEGDLAVFHVCVSPAEPYEVSFSYATQDGTATSEDYYATGGTLRIPSGRTTGEFGVLTNRDLHDTSSEDLAVALDDAYPAGMSLPSSTTGTILHSRPTLSIDSPTVIEGELAVFTVSLSGTEPYAVSSLFATQDGSATSEDYEGGGGMLIFLPGESSIRISLPSHGDPTNSSVEQFTGTLTSVLGATPSTVTGTASIVQPTIELLPIDTAASELSDNELIPVDPAKFLLTRNGGLDADFTVYLGFGGTADRESYQLTINGAIVTDSVVIPAGVEEVVVTFWALQNDMTAGPTAQVADVTLVPSPYGSYVVGRNSATTITIADTSTWREVATDGKHREMPDWEHVHPAAPTSGTGYTVVIIGGGCADDDTNERDKWTREARTAFGPTAYIYNDVTNAVGFVNVLNAFPDGTISKVVLSGHGTVPEEVGIQSTNNNTVEPDGYKDIDSVEILKVERTKLDAVKRKFEPGALLDIQACGGPYQLPNGFIVDERFIRYQAASRLAHELQCEIRYAYGDMTGFNAPPITRVLKGKPFQGRWIRATPDSHSRLPPW
jgi:hypothetical protein